MSRRTNRKKLCKSLNDPKEDGLHKRHVSFISHLLGKKGDFAVKEIWVRAIFLFGVSCDNIPVHAVAFYRFRSNRSSSHGKDSKALHKWDLVGEGSEECDNDRDLGHTGGCRDLDNEEGGIDQEYFEGNRNDEDYESSSGCFEDWSDNKSFANNRKRGDESGNFENRQKVLSDHRDLEEHRADYRGLDDRNSVEKTCH